MAWIPPRATAEVGTQCAFDVKCLGLNANQDAGSQTKDQGLLKNASLYYLTANSVGVKFGVGDIITYGSGAFRTGQCCGWVTFNYNGSTYDCGVDSFDEIKTGGDVYYRFNCRYINFRSASFVPDGT